MQSIRIYDMPACRMIASRTGMFGDEAIDSFCDWLSRQPRTMFPNDFLYWDDSDPAHPGFRWLYLYREGLELPPICDVIGFDGGIYAVATDVDQQTDTEAMKKAVLDFITAAGFEPDPTRRELGNIITSPQVQQVMGYEQMDYYFPIRAKK